MTALQTPVELRRRLISAPGLEEPPCCFVMTALGTFNLGCGEGVEFVLLVADDLYRRGRRQFLLSGLGDGLPCLVGVTAVVAEVCDGDFLTVLQLL